MKSIFDLSVLFSFIFVIAAYAQPDVDWANLRRFKEANAKLSAPKPDKKRIVFMGNSITEGWLSAHPAFFEGKPYVNRGIGGQTTPQMVLRMYQDVIELQPKVVVILAGTNDIAGNTGPATNDQIINNIAAMTELALSQRIRVVLSSILPVFDYPWKPGLQPASRIKELNQRIKDLCAQKKCVYLDYWSAMADERGGLPVDLATDGVHPTLKGYQVMEPLVGWQRIFFTLKVAKAKVE